MMDFDSFANHYKKPVRIKPAKGCKKSVQVVCPCHNDRRQSLVISEAHDGKILLHCYAGCDPERILEAVGLTMKDICSDPEKTSVWKERIAWYYSNKYVWIDDKGIQHNGYGEGIRVTDEYRYYDENSNYLYSKVRIEGGLIPGKLIRYYTINDNADTAKACKMNDLKRSLYRLPEFLMMKDKADWVYIVEGEKDCETLRKIKSGFGCVTTAGGASDWKDEYARYFKGLKVIILRDNDNAGLKCSEQIMNSLRHYAHVVKIVNPSQLDHGDVTDFLTKEGGTAQGLKELCENVTEKHFAKWVKLTDKGEESGILTGVLAEAISENETYSIVRNPDDDKDDLFFYEGGVYRKMNRPSLKGMIREYLPASKVTDNMLNNVANLLFATNNRIHELKEFNTDERYINLKSGLYDIENKTLLPHTPDFYSTIQFPFDYSQKKIPCPTFDKYINDLCTKADESIDNEQIKIIQEYFGFLISNVPASKVKAVLILWSRLGNTGKSVLIRLITKLFGVDRIAAIKLKELTSENRFILGTLPKCRVITCGDESNSNVKDSGIFKSLTGGDPVKIEPKGRQGYTLFFNGGFVIACNGLPYIEDDKGDHLYNRLLILPCEHYITEEMKDADLDRKLEQELPGIFQWAMEGLFRLKENKYNFTKSKSSEAAKTEYRMNMDNVYRFIVENYYLTKNYSDKVSVTEFKDAYHIWCSKDNNVKEVDRKNLTARLDGYGIKEDKANIEGQRGVMVYRGLKRMDPVFKDSDPGDEVPFQV